MTLSINSFLNKMYQSYNVKCNKFLAQDVTTSFTQNVTKQNVTNKAVKKKKTCQACKPPLLELSRDPSLKNLGIFLGTLLEG